MELLDYILKAVSVGGLLGLIGGIWGAVTWGKRFQKTLSGMVYLKYTERYEQIMESCPDGGLTARLDSWRQVPELTEPMQLFLLRYLNLCSEEYCLWKHKYLDQGIWGLWQTEMQRMLSTPLFRRGWSILRREFESYPDFCDFVEAIHSKMETNLKRWVESGDPERWVNLHGGSWDHHDWYLLLARLQGSGHWPMEPHEVGRVLEDIKTNGRAGGQAG